MSSPKISSDHGHANIDVNHESDPEKFERGSSGKHVFKRLRILDRLLTPIILLAMIVGVLIGVYVKGVQEALDVAHLDGVSVPIAIGLIIMMWPILAKVQYETFPHLFSSSKIWIHILLSLILNWIIGPLVMLGLAWATLPDLPTYRVGVILVGLARCIAMVMVWNEIAKGHAEYCAILVGVNSVLQIVLYAPYAVFFINIIGGEASTISVSYRDVSISVLIYLGIPLVAGVLTRYGVWFFVSKSILDTRVIPIISPISLIGLIYTVIVIFAYQGKHITENIGLVFRVFLPLVLYFLIMWTSAFGVVYWINRRSHKGFGYEMAVVQAFTAGSNNFELAIAIAVSVFGVASDQALAATIGPLVEVPVLLALTWVSLWIGERFYNVERDEKSHMEVGADVTP